MSNSAFSQLSGLNGVSIASANGFTGVSSGGANPSLTLSTSITGVLLGDGTAISAATTTGTGAVALANTPILTTPFAAATPANTQSNNGLATTAFIRIANVMMWGTAVDGTVVISSGTTILARDMHYNNLTISGTGSLITNGWRIYIAGTLDLSAAPANAITYNGLNGNNGSGATGGASVARGGGTQIDGANGTLPSSLFSSTSTGVGGNGGITNGVAGGNGQVSNNIIVVAGLGRLGGNGGASSGTGGTAGTIAANGSGYGTQYQMVSPYQPFLTYQGNQGTSPSLLTPGQYGTGGGGGGGDTTNSGGGGGSVGRPGGTIWICAFNIQRGTNTTAGIIASKAGTSGNGANGVAGNAAGGGGGGGSGGGWVLIFTNQRLGSTITNCIDVSGAAGGNGGNGVGTGLGGLGGTGGNSGNVQITELSVPSFTSSTFNGVGSAPSAPSGATGGIGGAKATLQVDL